MKKDTRVTIQCPLFRRGKKFEGIITGEKTLAALHIAKHGRTYFVKLDGNNKSTQFHESWLAELPAPSTPVKETEPAPTSQIIYVRNLDTGEIEDWTIGQLLHRINEDNATDGFNYNENDWEEGFKETLEGEFYSLFDEKGNLLNGITPTSKEGLEDGGFTKGEWVIESTPNDGDTSHIICSEDKETTIAGIYKWPVEGYHKEAEANARLIAAAPAMYEALKDCLKCLTMDSDMEEDFAPEIKKAKTILTRINKH